ELFWAGLVTPDTFSAIVAGTVAPRAEPPRPPQRGRRTRRGARRAPLARLPVIGRWSALPEEEGLSPEEREEARAHLLLARYGVLSRELAQGDWSTLRHTLLRMEYGGEVVRGYFVEGLSGEQYALEDTLRELETPARRAEPHVLVTIADPANLWGRVFTLTRRDGQRAAAARIPTTWLIARAGRPVLLVEGQGRSLTPLAGWEAVDLPGAIRALQAVVEPPLPLRRVRRLDVEEWEGRPIRESEAFDAFVAAGFSVAGPCDLPRGPCGRIAWIGMARAEPIKPVLALVRLARDRGVDVFFLTGRPERLRAATEANLRAAGYGWGGVILKPDDLTTKSAADFKAPERKKLQDLGYTIIVNIGDQMSDLDGGFAERTYKLPNPFYFIP